MANKNCNQEVTQKLHSKRCANPLNVDSHVGKDLRNISKSLLEVFPNLHEKSKICQKCRKSASESQKNESRGSNATDSNYLEDVSENDSEFEHELPTKKARISREDALEELLNGLKEKFNNLPENSPMRKTILTIAPECWTAREIAQEFGCSYRMALESKTLRKSSGVLATPTFKKGKNLDAEVVSKVIEFYESEENSRIMPNKKDTVIVKIEGQKFIKEKHLLLYDIKVLHEMFKEKYPEHKIGSTKFAELRPKWCVIAGSSGTHSVCVCTIHQNVKTMIDAINLKTLTKGSEIELNDYKDCINYILCRKSTTDCFLLNCQKCPKMEEFSELVTGLLEKNKIEQVIFSTWESTDRCTLIQQCLSTDDFVEELCNRLKLLIPHNFIAKAQSEFLTNKKENLREDEVLVFSDFSENFAYVIQDAAQAFHYNNDQCTVFPVVFYYRSKNEIKHNTIILLSDCTKHDAAAVHLMQEKVIPVIKKLCSKVKKIYYASDGAKQHFKNRTQMNFLMHHKQDFGIDAEWHFNATAHSKCSCDGAGACLKSAATRYSLQAHPNDAILNSVSLFNWAKSRFQNIHFFHYTKEDHRKILQKLNRLFPDPPAVPKIQSSHAFIPCAGNKLKIKRFSNAKDASFTLY